MSDLALLLVVILVVLLLFRGPKVLPRLGAALGRGVKEARDNVDRGSAEEADERPPSS